MISKVPFRFVAATRQNVCHQRGWRFNVSKGRATTKSVTRSIITMKASALLTNFSLYHFNIAPVLTVPTIIQRRKYHELSYTTNGEPIDVLKYNSDLTIKNNDPYNNIPSSFFEYDNTWCHVEMLHVPWNPADVNMIQGKYPSPHNKSSSTTNTLKSISQSQYFSTDNQRQHPTVVGSEGWGRVTKVISSNDNPRTNDDSLLIQEGSLVTFGLSGLGVARSSIWVPSRAIHPIPNNLVEKLGPSGSSLFQLGGTALRMLSDFCTLEPGDIVIQNAGNSGVGLLVSQLASSSTLFSAPVISIVRKGSKTSQQYNDMVQYFKHTGKAAMIIAEEDLLDASDKKQTLRNIQDEICELSGTGQLPKLALNAVGGTSAELLLKLIQPSGTMVTYGGMSTKPIQITTPQFIFKDFRLMGYWHSRWMSQHSWAEKQIMIDTLVKTILEEDTKCPLGRVFSIKDYKEALQWQAEQSNTAIRSKLIWDCQER